MGLIDYDGRTFVPSDGSPAWGRYAQHGDVISAEIGGPAVRAGALVGRSDAAGVITAAYCQVLATGEIVGGTVRSTPTRLADGRIRLTERWRRHDGTTGTSTIEETT
jgi:hypothetical protein